MNGARPPPQSTQCASPSLPPFGTTTMTVVMIKRDQRPEPLPRCRTPPMLMVPARLCPVSRVRQQLHIRFHVGVQHHHHHHQQAPPSQHLASNGTKPKPRVQTCSPGSSGAASPTPTGTMPHPRPHPRMTSPRTRTAKTLALLTRAPPTTPHGWPACRGGPSRRIGTQPPTTQARRMWLLIAWPRGGSSSSSHVHRVWVVGVTARTRLLGDGSPGACRPPDGAQATAGCCWAAARHGRLVREHRD